MPDWTCRCEVSQGRPLPTARLLGAVDGALEGVYFVLNPVQRLEYDRNLAAARAALGEAACEEARRAGRAMPLGQAVRQGLEVEDEPQRCKERKERKGFIEWAGRDATHTRRKETAKTPRRQGFIE